MQAGRVCLCSAGAMGLQTLLNHTQENAQCGLQCALVALQVVALQVVAQAFGDRQHPLAHRQMGKYVVAQMGGGLGHAPGVARWADTAAFAGEGHQVVMPAVITAGASEDVGKDAAFQIFAKGFLYAGRRGMLIALAGELAGVARSSQVSKCSATVRYSRVRSGWRGL